MLCAGVVPCHSQFTAVPAAMVTVLGVNTLAGPTCTVVTVVAVVVNVTAPAGASWVVALNDLELVTLAVFVTNVLVQSGMRARDLAFLVSGLAVYDVVGRVARRCIGAASPTSPACMSSGCRSSPAGRRASSSGWNGTQRGWRSISPRGNSDRQ